MDNWEIPETLTPVITTEAMNGKEIHSRQIRRTATSYRPWRDILSGGSKLFRNMEVFHNLGIEEVILVYTRFEEGTNLENFDMKLVPPSENKLEILMRFFQDNRNVWLVYNIKRSAAQLGDAHHDHVVNVQEQALWEIERLCAQGNDTSEESLPQNLRCARGWKAPKFRYMEARPVEWTQGRQSKPRFWIEE